MKKIIIILILLFYLCNIYKLKAQVITIYDTVPLIPKNGIYNTTKTDSVIMPLVNVDSLLQKEQNNNEPYRFGYAIDANFGLNNSGKWDLSKSEGKIWKLKIIAKNAYSINLIFDKFYLPESAVLYIYNKNRTMIYGPVTSLNCGNSGVFASDLLSGDAIILEYFEPYTVIQSGQINISKVIYGYKDMFGINKNKGKGYGDSGDCEIDIRCSEGNDWCVEARAVAMTTGGGYTCSGAMINNVREDLIPYFLTANHCLSVMAPGTTVFRFNYKNPYCGSDEYYGSYWSFSGATLRANNSISDFALLELNTYNPYNNIYRIEGIHFAGWDRNNIPPNSTTGIHHPRGDVMKIHLDYDPAISNQNQINWDNGSTSQINTHWITYIDNGAMEGGSSGSFAFNQNHRIVGQLHGGHPGCGTDGLALYGRFDVSWTGGGTNLTRLSNWLDPDNTGVMSVDAISPTIVYHNKTITGGPHLYTATDEMELAGYVNGYPVMPLFWNPSHWPWPENNQPFIVESGANVTFKAGKRIVVKPGVHIKKGARAHGYIGNVTCADGLDYLYNTGPNKENQYPQDNYNYKNNSSVANTKQIYNKANNLSFDIYPNPNNGIITLKLLKDDKSFVSIEITNILGELIYKKDKIKKNLNIIDLSTCHKGIYFIKIITNTNAVVKKIIIQ